MKNKKIWIVSLIIMMLIFGGGCGLMSGVKKYTIKQKYNTAEEKKELALSYLEENYDDTFTPEGYMAACWAYDYDLVTFTPAKYPDGVVNVEIHEEDGELLLKDNYFKLYMHDDAYKYLDDVISEVIDSYNLFFVELDEEELPPELDNQSTFLDYVASEQCDVVVYITTPERLDDETEMKIVQRIADNKIRGFVYFWEIEDETALSRYSFSEIVNRHSNLILYENSYTIHKDFTIDVDSNY